MGHRKYKTPEYIIMPENKEVLRSDKGRPNTEASFRDAHSGKTWDNSSIKITVVLDCIPMNKGGI